MAHQIAFAVIIDAVAQDVVMHSPGDVDRVNLDVAVVGEGRAYVWSRFVEQERAAHKSARGQEVERKRAHGKDERPRKARPAQKQKAAPDRCGLGKSIDPAYFFGVAA
jgi:hypothetical protein